MAGMEEGALSLEWCVAAVGQGEMSFQEVFCAYIDRHHFPDDEIVVLLVLAGDIVRHRAAPEACE